MDTSLAKTISTVNTISSTLNYKKNNEEIDKSAIQESNQEIKDKSKQAFLNNIERESQQKQIDIYVETSKKNSEESNKTSPEIYTFDPQEVNKTRNHHTAISLYKDIEKNNEDYENISKIFSIEI